MLTIKNLISILAGAAVIALGTASAAPGSAADITFKFTGTVDYLEDYSGLFGPSVQIGSPISGSYTFNSAASNSNPADPTFGSYESSGGPYGVAFSVGNDTFAGNNVYISVATGDSLYDSFYSVYGEIDVPDPFAQSHPFSLSLSSPTQNVFSSDALPLTPPNLDLFTAQGINFDYNFLSGGSSFSGTLTSLTVAAVPEPLPVSGTLALAAFGAAGYIFRKQKLTKI